jgi:hypothetical protein
MSWIIENLVRLKGWPLYRRFDRATKDAVEVQRSLLLNILKKNAETEFGRKYGFQRIRNEADYQKKVPLQDYEALALHQEVFRRKRTGPYCRACRPI